MRTLASICLAFVLAVTFGWAKPVRADVGSTHPAVAHCADMDMAGPPARSTSSPEPAKHTAHGDCAMTCNVGCAVAAEDATVRIGEPIAWHAAFGLPAASLNWRSTSPEAELPPPRTALV